MVIVAHRSLHVDHVDDAGGVCTTFRVEELTKKEANAHMDTLAKPDCLPRKGESCFPVAAPLPFSSDLYTI